MHDMRKLMEACGATLSEGITVDFYNESQFTQELNLDIDDPDDISAIDMAVDQFANEQGCNTWSWHNARSNYSDPFWE